MNRSITKIMNMNINHFQAAIYFNIYIIKSVFFRCGIVQSNAQEELELKQIYEAPILTKLGISKNFRRTVLYLQKSALWISLMFLVP